MSALSRRQEALRLAEELLSDIELSRASPPDLALKTSRLARLLDDFEAATWLRYEVAGYPKPLDGTATWAVARSNRAAPLAPDGSPLWWTAHLAELRADVESASGQLSSPEGATSSADSALLVEREKAQNRQNLRQHVIQQSGLIQRIVGSFHDYVFARYQELRFGSAVETAFDVVREEVDGAIASLVPDALPKLSAAFENTTSDNPEDWASAAATCRRLLKAAADALRPPGLDVGGRKMGEDQYINRLVDWITSQSASQTAAEMIAADLDYLGRRLDAAADAGHKGAHADVTRYDASRFVTGTYLLLGDVLRLRAQPSE